MGTTFTFEALMQAAVECARGVRWKDSVSSWVHPRNLASNCLLLLQELEQGTYHLSGYSVFNITSPKPRTIRAPKFRDRVVQRAMCNLGLYDDLTRDCIYDNSACLVGKGTKFAMDRLSCQMQRFWRKHGTHGWVFRMDIQKFFDSIPHDRLKNMVRRKVRNPEFVWLTCEVIDSFSDPGIGLGSQLSQLLAISYLSDFDHRIKEVCGMEVYERYSDDAAMVHPDLGYLRDVREDAEVFLKENKGLELNRKTTIHPLAQGIVFLKFKFTLTATGKVTRMLAKSNISACRRRLRKLNALAEKGERSKKDIVTSFESWKAHADLGNSYETIRRMEAWLPTTK